MAVVVVAEVEGGNQDMYEQVSSKAIGAGQLPEGGKVHIAGPTENGWRVITVWDSEEQFHKFRNERLIPALEASGQQAAPEISVDAVHTLITA